MYMYIYKCVCECVCMYVWMYEQIHTCMYTYLYMLKPKSRAIFKSNVNIYVYLNIFARA